MGCGPFTTPGHPLVILWSEHREALKILHSLDPKSLRDADRIKFYVELAKSPTFHIDDIELGSV